MRRLAETQPPRITTVACIDGNKRENAAALHLPEDGAQFFSHMSYSDARFPNRWTVELDQ